MKKQLHCKKILLLLGISLFISVIAQSQTATVPALGDGTEGNPYQITCLDNLYWLSEADTVWDKHFIQIADIDARTTKGWDNDSGFIPISNADIKFTGIYNGNGYVIDSLYIKRPDKAGVGFFKYLGDGSEVKNLGITNCSIEGEIHVGGIAGLIYDAQVSQSYVTGELKANGTGTYVPTGGLAGYCAGEVNSCYTNIDIINIGDATGGFIGVTADAAKISNCFSKGSLVGQYRKGGLIGIKRGEVKNCYSVVSMSESAYTGGLIGLHNGGTVTACFWDEEASGISDSDEGAGYSTEVMKHDTTYTRAGWDFACETENGTEDIWESDTTVNDGYPFLVWQKHANGPVPEKVSLDTVRGENSVSITSYPKATGFYGKTITATTIDPLTYTTGGIHTVNWVYKDCNGVTSSQKQIVEVTVNTSVQNISGNGFTCYPNPVKHMLYFNLDVNAIKSIKITDLTGKVHLYNQNIKENTLDVSSLKNGMYILMIETGTKNFVSRIIKE